MAGRQLATNQQINAIVFDELKIWPRFGFYAAQRLRPEMERVAPATTLKIISKSKFSAFTIPLPPLEEQKRIAWILDQADAVRRLRTRALDKLNTLGQAIFHEMFGRFQFGTGDWPTVELGELVKDAKIGLVRGVTEQGDELPVRYLRMDSISVDGALSFEGLRSVEANQNEIGSYGLIIGDFLLNTRNSRELVGKTAVVREAFDGVYNNNILRLRFDNRMCGAFLDSYLRTPSGKNALENQKSGTTSVFAIYQKSLMKMPIPLPPVELQRLFTERLSILFREKGRSVRSAQQFKYLFASLQHRAFRGDL
jgi:type I restriction enzyme S subunit